ncbi:conserved hypothetical protein [Methanolacinia petrolearia DSM 11571]|uniref:Uncharacterized protein n=1 Tax=Methanolacinia petrolearia (strain DSM 11571 / OCM 486 / SEBR 4847) TaxID=679926 RepID=E1RDI9_METP4|nr:hypothetical protein [Methanolacinia petrolearia]ADN35942.1 conserved hypothetical protein [Methanolacinia petrolearia DSM 11571]
MSAEGNEVLAEAERLADALAEAKNEMSLNEYLLMLIEMNMKIEEITKIDYGSICAPYSDYNCS